MKRCLLFAAFCMFAPMAVMAQDAAANPLASTLRQSFELYSRYLVGAAQEMPADKYSYHPVMQEMTFGMTIEHVAEVNNFACSKVSGMPASQAPKAVEADGKDKLVAGLKASMEYCAEAFSKLTDANLAQTVPFFGGRPVTRLGAAMEVTNDLIDHYAALSVYLRLNGLLPPSAQKNL